MKISEIKKAVLDAGYHPTPKLIAAVEKAIVKQLHRKFIGHVFAEVMRHTPPPKPEPVE